MITKTIIFRSDHLAIIHFTGDGVRTRHYNYSTITKSSKLRIDQLQYRPNTDYRYHIRADNNQMFVMLDWK